MIQQSWEKVTSETISDCFKKTGFIFEDNGELDNNVQPKISNDPTEIYKETNTNDIFDESQLLESIQEESLVRVCEYDNNDNVLTISDTPSDSESELNEPESFNSKDAFKCFEYLKVIEEKMLQIYWKLCTKWNMKFLIFLKNT